MKKKMNALLLLVALMALAAGCSTKEKLPESANTTTQTKEEQEVDQNKVKLGMIEPFAYSNIEGLNVKEGSYISIIGRSTSSAYWKEVQAGAKQAVADLNEKKGFEGKDKVKLVYSAPTDLNDVDQQINILDEEMARYPVAIAIAPADRKAFEVQFDLATENNIALVTFDTGSEYKGIMSHIGTDNREAMKQIVENLDKKLEEKAKVLIVSGDDKLLNEEERRNLAKELLGESSKKYEIMEPVLIEQIKEDEKSLANIIKETKDLKGIITTGDLATSEVATLLQEEESKDINVFGFDTARSTDEAIKEGYIDGVIEQNPYAMGYSSVVAALRASLDMGNEAKVDTGFIWLTKKNVAQEENRLY